MAIEGSLDEFHLPEILQAISAQAKTGILTVQGEHDIVAVSFKGGEVVAADALNQTVEDGLGQVLANEGLVSPQDFSAVASEHEAGGRRLLDLLLERRLVTREQLLAALRVQTYQLLLQLMRWDNGDFKFYGGEEVAFEEGFAPISIPELLVRSISDLGDEGDRPRLEEVYEPVPDGPPVRYIGRDGEGPADDRSAVWLTPEDRRLVDGLDGRTPAGEIARAAGIGEYRALFALHQLLQAQAVRRVTAPRPAARPPQPAPAAESAEISAPPGRAPAPVAAPEASPRPARSEPPAEKRPSRPPAPTRAPRPVAPASAAPFLRVLAAVAAVVVVLVLAAIGDLLVAPLPWHGEPREQLARSRRSARMLQIDRATRTFFLLEGRYPPQLADLVVERLLDRRSLHDPGGRPLAYAAGDVSYEVVPLAGGEPVEELAAREAITGDFLLDPDFLDVPEPPETQPLVLLD